MVEKKLPGKGWEYMVYDKQDRLVATQDANMKVNNQWLFTKYDKFGRVAYTGIATGSSRTAEQTSADTAQSNYVERKTSIAFNQNGLDVYYGNPTNITSYPSTIVTLLSVNYYDEYPTGISYQPTTIESQTVIGASGNVNLKGLPVASFVKNIEDNGWTKTYTYYDQKARPIGTHSDNYLGGYTRTATKLKFSGKPEYTLTYHKKADRSDVTTIKETFEYDNQERVTKHWHQVNNTGNNELLAENIYNEIGQLQSKKVGGNSSTPLQNVDYNYNIRGWMTQINANADGTLQTNKLFNYRIFYNTLNPEFTGGIAKYNGNIAQITWKSNYANADDKVRNYSYEYDSLNRLLNARYFAKGTTNDQDYYNENLAYDLNGNINNLQRFTKPPTGTNAQLIDGLNYSYEGNRLTRVWDWSYNNSGFKDDSNSYDTTDDYGYDDNGNMIRDDNKNIISIKYNFLNLPTEIVLPNSEKVNYFYRADGTKVKKVRIINQGGKTANETTDYLDGFQYQSFSSYSYSSGSKLLFFPTAEGYYSTDLQNNPYNPQSGYVYNYTDHLGNVRLSYYKNPTTGSIEVLEENNYYPFGLKHEGYNSLAGNQSYNYKYNGKELQETGMYDYGARFYMPDIGRWGVIDELAEKYNASSTYGYVSNNPIIYIDPDGRDEYRINTQTGEIEISKTKSKTHSYYLIDKDNNETFVGSFKYNKKGLIQLPSSYSAQDSEGNTFGFTVKEGNEYRSYINGDAMASLIGTVAETKTNDLTVVGFSLSDGSSPAPSVSHKDGKNGDLRYLRKDGSGDAVLLNQKQFDIERQNTFNAALNKYGWKSMLSEQFTPAGSSNKMLLDYTKHYSKSRHNNHLHLQSYKPTIKTVYEGGAIQPVIITKKKQ